MLTPRENYYQAAKGLNPDRFANQYEALRLCLNPSFFKGEMPSIGGEDKKNSWGVTYSWPANTPAAYPNHRPDLIVIQDIEEWKKYVKAPSLDDIPNEQWDMCREIYDSVDTSIAYKACFIAPGLFEQCHHLGEMQNTLMNLVEYEDEMHELIKYFTDYELRLADLVCSKLKPDACFHHDDWGGRNSTFLSPEMFAEFFVEPYKEIYKFYHEHGCELVVHHSDSYGRNLIPYMTEMGIDVWQGCMSSNNIPEIRKEYCGKIGFMGGFDGADFDKEDFDPADIKKRVFETLDGCDPKGWIPCIAQGGPGSVYDGVYEAIFDAIDDYNEEKFGIKKSEIKRSPMQLEKKGYM